MTGRVHIRSPGLWVGFPSTSMDVKSTPSPSTAVALQWRPRNRPSPPRQSMGIQESYSEATVPWGPYFVGIFPEIYAKKIGSRYGRYLQWIGSWVMAIEVVPSGRSSHLDRRTRQGYTQLLPVTGSGKSGHGKWTSSSNPTKDGTCCISFDDFLNTSPLENVNITLENTIFKREIHYKWPFSIAMSNYQRVTWIQ